MENLKEVTIYTDGGSHGNPGPGGYGAVLLYDKKRKVISMGYRLTTNNRMEILAAIKALESLKFRCKVTLYSDSKYLVDAMNLGWVDNWQTKGWKRAKNKPVLNIDLWQKLLKLCAQHLVTFVWVQGHAGVKENEFCDSLIKKAVKGNNLQIDEEYEKINATKLS